MLQVSGVSVRCQRTEDVWEEVEPNIVDSLGKAPAGKTLETAPKLHMRTERRRRVEAHFHIVSPQSNQRLLRRNNTFDERLPNVWIRTINHLWSIHEVRFFGDLHSVKMLVALNYLASHEIQIPRDIAGCRTKLQHKFQGSPAGHRVLNVVFRGTGDSPQWTIGVLETVITAHYKGPRLALQFLQAGNHLIWSIRQAGKQAGIPTRAPTGINAEYQRLFSGHRTPPVRMPYAHLRTL